MNTIRINGMTIQTDGGNITIGLVLLFFNLLGFYLTYDMTNTCNYIIKNYERKK